MDPALKELPIIRLCQLSVCQLTIPKGQGFEIFAIYPPLPIIRHIYVVAGQNLEEHICQLTVFANYQFANCM
jgi:hypothetical protein